MCNCPCISLRSTRYIVISSLVDHWHWDKGVMIEKEKKKKILKNLNRLYIGKRNKSTYISYKISYVLYILYTCPVTVLLISIVSLLWLMIDWPDPITFQNSNFHIKKPFFCFDSWRIFGTGTVFGNRNQQEKKEKKFTFYCTVIWYR